MQERAEGSVLTSLGELRAIERARQEEAQAAVEAATDAKRVERARAERAAKDAALAWQAAEREARSAVAREQAESERRARQDLEAAEAAARARHLVALEAKRLDEELAIQREAARRQRPTWMIAVTATAIAVAAGLGWVAAKAGREADHAEAAQHSAIAAKDRAKHEAEAARLAAERLARDYRSIEAKLDTAIRQVEDAQAASQRRVEQQRERDAQHRVFEARQAAELREQERLRKERLKPIEISSECLNNALCKK